DRLHLHIGGEQIVACMSADVGGLIQEHLDWETLAYQTSVVIGKTHNHCLDLLPCRQVAQLFKAQQSLQSDFSLAQSMPPQSARLGGEFLPSRAPTQDLLRDSSRLCALAVNAAHPAFTTKTRRRKEGKESCAKTANKHYAIDLLDTSYSV